MRAGPQARRPTLMRGGLEKSTRKFYAGWAKGQPTLSPLFFKNVIDF